MDRKAWARVGKDAGGATVGALAGVGGSLLLAALLRPNGPTAAPVRHAAAVWLGLCLATLLLAAAVVGRAGRRPRTTLLSAGLALWATLPFGAGSAGVPPADLVRLAGAPLLLLATLALPLSGTLRSGVAVVGVWLVAFPASVVTLYAGAWSGAFLVLAYAGYLLGWAWLARGWTRRLVAGATALAGLAATAFIVPELLEYADAASLAIALLGLAAAAAGAAFALRPAPAGAARAA